jgi:hypothetical protein
VNVGVAFERRRALQAIAVLVAAVVVEHLIVRYWRYSLEMVAYRTTGNRTFMHERGPWFAAHASFCFDAVAVSGAAAAVFLCPAFVSGSMRRATRWAAAFVVAGLVYLFAISDAHTGGFYWYLVRSDVSAVFHGHGEFLGALIHATLAHFPLRTIPIALGLVVAGWLLHRGLPTARRARGALLAVAVVALVCVGPVGARGVSATPDYRGEPVGDPTPALAGAVKVSDTGLGWRLARWYGIPFALVRPHLSQFFFSGENSPTARISLQSVGLGAGTHGLADVCDNTVLRPCWSADRGWSGLEAWRRSSGLLYVTRSEYASERNRPVGVYEVRPRIDAMGLALWTVLPLLFWRRRGRPRH